jgi:hypothetical protein
LDQPDIPTEPADLSFPKKDPLQRARNDALLGHMVDISGAFDVHLHPYPCLIPRIADDLYIAQDAAQRGLRGFLIKCHHESSVSRAYIVRQVVPGLEVYGGIVLNTYVGGINPSAVYAALRLGGKEVWMPTIDAWHHGQVYGRTGAYDVQGGGRDVGEGIKILDDRGKLKPEVYEVLDLIAEYNVILGTCHLSLPEIDALIREALRRKVQKILITHPFFKVVQMPLNVLAEYVKMGAYAEFGYCTVSPQWHDATIQQVAEAVKRIGAERAVIMSDTGQRHNPTPAESLRVFAQGLYELGIAESEIRKMACDNPAQLVGLEHRE